MMERKIHNNNSEAVVKWREKSVEHPVDSPKYNVKVVNKLKSSILTDGSANVNELFRLEVRSRGDYI